MYKKLLLSMFMAVFLVACGQGIEQESNVDDIDKPIEVGEGSLEETDSDTENPHENQPAQEDKSGTTVPASLPELNVHYIDVGQADATLLQYGEHSILFDVGDWRGDEVVNYLKEQGISTLDLVIGSHPDADHIGQLADVMNTFDVEEVWLSGNVSTSQSFQSGLEAVLNSGANYHEPRAGEEFDIGPMSLKILYPQSISGASNEESISVLFTYGEVKFLFTGDADSQAEKRMMNLGVDADILQLGHHGSSTSSDPAFIKAVSPDIAIYSAGADNSYGHPHQEVVSLMQNSSIKLYGTDVHGTIIVTTDGNEYTLKTKKDGTVTPKNTASNSKPSSSSKNTNSETNTNEKPSGSCVNINTASIEEVQKIKHIGPERAQDLINLRPFSSVQDLDRIKGIGSARINDILAQGVACVN